MRDMVPREDWQYNPLKADRPGSEAENVPLGASTRWPGWAHVTLRTLLYALGVLIVLLLEKTFEMRHEHDGVIPALIRGIQEKGIHHIWATTLGVMGALLVFNALFIIRRHLGDRALLRMFTAPLPAPAEVPPTDPATGLPHERRGAI